MPDRPRHPRLQGTVLIVGVVLLLVLLATASTLGWF